MRCGRDVHRDRRLEARTHSGIGGRVPVRCLELRGMPCLVVRRCHGEVIAEALVRLVVGVEEQIVPRMLNTRGGLVL